MKYLKFLLIPIFLFTITPVLFAQKLSSEGHSKAVTDISIQADCFYTVSDDGFIIKWDKNNQGEAWQISELEIKKICVNPKNNTIAVYETDEFSIHRVSVWNWTDKKRIFAKRFSESVSYLSYSAAGTWLMVGTNSVNGLVFLNPDNGQLNTLLKEPTGIVNYATTSETEASLMVYATSGLIQYYDLKTGVKKASFKTEADLQNVSFYTSNTLIAAIKQNSVLSIKATSGQSIQKIISPKAQILTTKDDSELFFLEQTQDLYTLCALDSAQRKKNLLKFNILNKETITCAAKSERLLIVATNTGTVYSTEIPDQTESILSIAYLKPISIKERNPVLDICANDTSFFALTNSNIYPLDDFSGNSFLPIQVPENTSYDKILATNNTLLLWVNNQKTPILVISDRLKSQKTQVFYVPSLQVQLVKVFNQTAVILEGNRKITLIDITTNKIKNSFNGTGFQDVHLVENTLYVAKSLSHALDSCLLAIDIYTSEMLIQPLSGDALFSLSGDDQTFYGLLLSGLTETKKTSLISFETKTRQMHTILSWADEDTTAFTMLNSTNIYTNLGKNNIIDLSRLDNSQQKIVPRTSSLPHKAVCLRSELLVLNLDGTVSWFDASTLDLHGVFYIDAKGQISY